MFGSIRDLHITFDEKGKIKIYINDNPVDASTIKSLDVHLGIEDKYMTIDREEIYTFKK